MRSARHGGDRRGWHAGRAKGPAAWLTRVLLASTALMHAASAYPWHWVAPNPDTSDRGMPTCLVHPDPAVDDGYTGYHPFIVTDSMLSIVVEDQSSKAAKTVCPGGSYSVIVSYDNHQFHALVTASQGSFVSALPGAPVDSSLWWYHQDTDYPAATCTNRLVSELSSDVSDELTIECGAKASKLQIKVTASLGKTDNLLQAALTLPLDVGCATAQCGGGAGPPPPAASAKNPPPRSPPPPLPRAALAPRPPPPVLAPPAALPAPPPVEVVVPTPPPPAPPASCEASDMGYACVLTVGPLRLHFTIGGAMPNNMCTAGGPTASQQSGDVVHMAVEASTTGYVGLGFSGASFKMAPADIVIGYVDVDGSSQASSYSTTGHDITEEDESAWATGLGVVRSANGQLVMCFTRLLETPLAVASPTLDLKQGVNLIWAMSERPLLVRHSSSGGASVNLDTSSVLAVDDGGQGRQLTVTRWHGALMAAAWALLLPLGAMLPRHRLLAGRWLPWVPLHMAVQALGVAFIVPAFAIAWRFLNPPISAIGDAHRAMGIAAFALLCLQFLAGALRPPPTSNLHAKFAIAHRWTGRVLLLLGWATCYVGIATFHDSIHRERYRYWLPPVSAALGFFLVLDVVLSLALGPLRGGATVKAVVTALGQGASKGSNGSAFANRDDQPSFSSKAAPSSPSPSPSSPPTPPQPRPPEDLAEEDVGVGTVTLHLDDPALLSTGGLITVHENPMVGELEPRSSAGTVYGERVRFDMPDDTATALGAGGLRGGGRRSRNQPCAEGMPTGRITMHNNPLILLYGFQDPQHDQDFDYYHDHDHDHDHHQVDR